MSTVAVVGVGIMGHGIADNFLLNGYRVIVWNRTQAKVKGLVAKGAIAAGSIEEAVHQADLVFEVTADDQSSRKAWFTSEGILASASPQQVLITCATLSAKWTDELAEKAQDLGLTFFDMAMTGGRIGAESGELILLAGGDEAKLNNIKPVLSAIAKEVKYFGKAGSGMRYKLVLNALQAIHLASFGEVLNIAKAAGLDEQLTGDALAERPGGITTNMAWRDYRTEPDPINFSVEWMMKDLKYAAEMAKTVRHPLLDIARQLYEQAVEQGYARSDWTKITKL